MRASLEALNSALVSLFAGRPLRSLLDHIPLHAYVYIVTTLCLVPLLLFFLFLHTRCLDVIQSLFPFSTCMERDISYANLMEIDGALLLDERKWPKSWSETPLHPASVTKDQLSQLRLTAVAILVEHKEDTLGDGLNTPTGARTVECEALQLAGWKVVTVDLKQQVWTDSGLAAKYIRDLLEKNGVVFPE